MKRKFFCVGAWGGCGEYMSWWWRWILCSWWARKWMGCQKGMVHLLHALYNRLYICQWCEYGSDRDRGCASEMERLRWWLLYIFSLSLLRHVSWCRAKQWLWGKNSVARPMMVLDSNKRMTGAYWCNCFVFSDQLKRFKNYSGVSHPLWCKQEQKPLRVFAKAKGWSVPCSRVCSSRSRSAVSYSMRRQWIVDWWLTWQFCIPKKTR